MNVLTSNQAQEQSPNVLILNGKSLSLDSIIAHIRDAKQKVELSETAWNAVRRSSEACDEIVRSQKACYGINLGFGEMIDIGISAENLADLQKSLILSHAVGVKQTLPVEISRTIFLLRLNSLANGASGIRPETMEFLLNLYNAGAYPEIYQAGSLGASGDLGPLAHFAAFTIGEGWGHYGGQRLRASEIYRQIGLEPIKLERKEGLALINGTSAMVAVAAHAVQRLRLYLEMTLLGMTLHLDCFRIPTEFVHVPAFRLKPHPGALYIAEFLDFLVTQFEAAEKTDKLPMQQVYSLRCVPFILGPLVESLRSSVRTLTIEANSVSDNPIFLEGEDYPYHGAHFHGQPVSVTLDQLRIAAVHLSGVIDRQLEFFLDRKRNPDINPFLAVSPQTGHCGLEGAQYLATSLHVENKALAHPISPLVVPANAGNQDYVSMGMQAALKSLELADNLKYIVGVYLCAALQAYSVKERSPSAPLLREITRALSEGVDFPYTDNRLFSELIDEIADDERYEHCVSLLYQLNPELHASMME